VTHEHAAGASHAGVGLDGSVVAARWREASCSRLGAVRQ